MIVNPCQCSEQAEVIPFLDSEIKRWVDGHEDREDELGIVLAEEDVVHDKKAYEHEENELVHHFK